MTPDKEPIRVPPYNIIATMNYYCLCCEEGFMTTNLQAMQNHFKSAHEEENPQRNVDYGSGRDIAQLQYVWEKWRDRETARAVRVLSSLHGVDDFLLECENDA